MIILGPGIVHGEGFVARLAPGDRCGVDALGPHHELDFVGQGGGVLAQPLLLGFLVCNVNLERSTFNIFINVLK